MKLTSASIRTIKPIPPKTDRIEFDDAVPGFGVRAREGGSQVYIVQYTIGEKTRRMTLGKVSLQGVDKAREKARTSWPPCAWARILPARNNKPAKPLQTRSRPSRSDSLPSRKPTAAKTARVSDLAHTAKPSAI